MLYYQIRFELLKNSGNKCAGDHRYKRHIASMAEQACGRYGNGARLVIDSLAGNSCRAIAVFDMAFVLKQPAEQTCAEFFGSIPLEGTVKSVEEITESSFLNWLRLAERDDFINDTRDVTDVFQINERGFDAEEKILKTRYTLPQARREAETLLCGDSLRDEIERIFAAETAAAFRGHPVHYMVSASGRQLADRSVELLLGSLYARGRLLSRRYSLYSFDDDNEFRRPGRGPVEEIGKIYRSMTGGAVIIDCSCLGGNQTEYADMPQRILQEIYKAAEKHRHDVLTIFLLPPAGDKRKESLSENLPNMTFVEIAEQSVFREDAKKYLKKRAAEKGVTQCRGLFKLLSEKNRGYSSADLNKLFDSWHDRYVRTELYPQYAGLAAVPSKEAKPIGDAYRDLRDLVGLGAAKEVIAQAVDFHKTRKLFKDNGIPQTRPAMHMVFTGNPGTAKTTVARLFGQIMKDNKLLPVGDLIEVGRADLVGKFVGWTAPMVQTQFDRAKGSVLFIDEAYSLVDDRGGLYGDEAINTIVQEMENRREDTVVIFAGYPDKMEAFLNRNPGLRSRIAFHVPFPDYTQAELADILRLMLKERQLSLTAEAEEKAVKILGEALTRKDFGNGRFVRTLIEKALLKQASRLAAMNGELPARQVLTTLTGEDFDLPAMSPVDQKRTVGFSA